MSRIAKRPLVPHQEPGAALEIDRGREHPQVEHFRERSGDAAGQRRDQVRLRNHEGQQVEVALIAPDGTITVSQTEANLESVAIADVDLLLRFSDGTFVIIPNGALDAAINSEQTVFFTTDDSNNDHQSSLGDLFKMVGITKIAGPGSVRVVSENVEVLQAL